MVLGLRGLSQRLTLAVYCLTAQCGCRISTRVRTRRPVRYPLNPHSGLAYEHGPEASAFPAPIAGSP